MELPIIIAAFVLGIIAGFFFGRSGAKSATDKTREAQLLGRQEAMLENLNLARDETEKLRAQLQEKSERAAALEESRKLLDGKLSEMQKQFEAISSKLFEENRLKFSEQSTNSLKTLINPLSERFVEFQKKVDESFGAQHQSHKQLKEEIGRIVLQADSLTKALKGDVKAQGNWGEVILERILESSGLQSPREYVVQGEGLGMKAGDGSHQKPDVIINLPDGRHLIIDSKVSLTHYERYCNEDDDTQKKLLLKQYTESVRRHAAGLADRRYHESEKLNSPEFVLMFMPIEGAFSLAVQQDAELHSYAWERKVAIVSPTTLFVTLQTVASSWKIETQNRNVMEIAKEGGALYDKFVGFVEDMQRIGERVAQTQKSYDDAMNKLSTGTGNLIKRTEKMKRLGAKAAKQLPEHLLDEVDEDDTTLPMLTHAQ